MSSFESGTKSGPDAVIGWRVSHISFKLQAPSHPPSPLSLPFFVPDEETGSLVPYTFPRSLFPDCIPVVSTASSPLAFCKSVFGPGALVRLRSDAFFFFFFFAKPAPRAEAGRARACPRGGLLMGTVRAPRPVVPSPPVVDGGRQHVFRAMLMQSALRKACREPRCYGSWPLQASRDKN